MEKQREDRIRLDDYILGRSLGKGSFGRVKLAEHLASNLLVAVKILNRKHMQKQNVMMKVTREVKILQKFSHPHIIRLFDVIETPSDIFLVLEYGSNGELFDYIVARGSLPEDEARKYFQQLASAIAYCHAHRITHRDLKPENILLTNDLDIKVADFGLSNVLQDGYFLRTSCGSPNYAAPEVISGRVYHGPEVDIWSCGVILYALLTGSLPFDEPNLSGLFKRIKSGYYNMPPLLNPDAKQLISKMLLVEPLKRATMQQVLSSPWYRTKLPRYLDRPAVEQSEASSEIDLELIRSVHRKFMNTEYVRKTGQTGVIRAVQSKQNNKIKTLYDMQLFEKRKLSREKRSTNSLEPGFHNTSEDSLLNALRGSNTGGAAVSPMDVEYNLEPTRNSSQHTPRNIRAAASNSLFARSCAQNGSPFDGTLQTNRPPPRDPNRRRWFLGIQSKKEADLVMREVFRVLKTLGAEWNRSPKTPYCVVCRWVVEDAEASDMQVKYYIKLQLLRVQSNICLLDFQRIGRITPNKFLDICAKIINSLKPPAPARRPPQSLT